MENINILCFGDSLTEGYTHGGTSFTPYAKSMESWIKSAWPSTKINVDIDGLSGDMVDERSGLFLTRIMNSCSKATIPYDFIIILGGTNDLGCCLRPDTIFSNLEKVYSFAHNYGANILALTIPECAARISWLNENRNTLNELIKGRGGKRFYVLDLHALIPYHDMDPSQRRRVWDDGLHLKPEGYDIMGQEIAKKLIELESKIENPKHLKLKETDEVELKDAEA